jgi:tetratricopeptide (TPR) repeat protein
MSSGSSAQPTAEQAAAAQEKLKIAHQYLKTYLDEKGENASRTLEFASRYVAEARLLDPNASIQVEHPNGKLYTYTVNEDNATVLYWQGFEQFHEGKLQHQLENRAARRCFLQAREAIEKAIKLDAGVSLYHKALAEALLELHERQQALAVARKALEAFPDNFELRKFVDTTEANRTAGIPPPITEDTDVGFYLMMAALLLPLGFGFIGYLQEGIGGAVAFCFGFALLVSLPLFVVGNFMSKRFVTRKLIEYEMRKQD